MKKTILFILLLVLGYGAYYVWQVMNRPAIGTVKMGEPPKKEEAFDMGSERKRFQGTYFSFPYAGKYAERRHEISEQGPLKETVFLAADDGQKIAVTVEELKESSSLDALPSFQMRENDKKTYIEKPLTVDGLSATVFEKNSQVFEQTAFFREGKFIVTVSASSPMKLEGLDKELSEVLEAFQWEK